MKLIFFIIAIIISVSRIAEAQNKIAQYEYWFDTNYAGKVSTTVTPAQYLHVNTNVATTGLSEGLHTIHIRFKDENSKFSSVMSSFFLKQGTQSALTNEIKNYEYWFDGNYASKITGTLPSNQHVTFSNLLSTNGLSNGLHTVHFRFKDATDKWSSVISQFFIKQGTGTGSATPELVEYEYWFDNDYANNQSVIMAGNQYENINSNINALALTNGLHTFHIRFRDANGNWSSVASQFFLKQEATTSISAQMLEYEYWFDSNYASKVNVPLPGNQYETVLSNLDASVLTSGLHTLHLRFKDASSRWSSVLSGFFIKNSTNSVLNNEIISYRYWFDQNDAAMITESVVTPSRYINITDAISMVTIPKGTHTIHFQFQDAQGMWSSVTNDTLFKNSLPIAQFSVNDSTLCDSGTVNFNNLSIDAEKFVWNFGDGNTSTDSLPTHTYSAPGLYTVSLTATDSTLFIDSTLSITQMIRIYETPDATITSNGNDSICNGNSITLSTSPNVHYLWSDGSTNQTLAVNTAGTYSVITYNPDDHSCFSASSPLTITMMPLPDASFTFNNVDHLVSFANTSSEGDNYFWNFGDGNFSNTFSPDHDYGVNGIYNAYLVSYNFCGSDTAFATIDLSFIGISAIENTLSIKLFPNPASSFVWISPGEENEKSIKYTVTDQLGKIVMQNTINEVNNRNLKIDLSELANGIYYFRIETSSGLIGQEKIIITK